MLQVKRGVSPTLCDLSQLPRGCSPCLLVYRVEHAGQVQGGQLDCERGKALVGNIPEVVRSFRIFF